MSLIKFTQNVRLINTFYNPKQIKTESKRMNKPQIIIDSIEVNIKAPQQLHVVRPHSARKSVHSSEGVPQTIEQQSALKESEQRVSSGHKIRHIESIEDKGEFIDETSHSRVSEKDQARETITRTIHPEPELSLEDADLQKITEEVVNQEENFKPIRHFNVESLIDRDEFNLRNSREKFTEQRKRRLSETNIKGGYLEENKQFSATDRLKQLHKQIPQKVIEEESNLNGHHKATNGSAKRRRKSSLHSGHEGMVVDELDKKKKLRIEDENQYDDQQPQMEQIKQEKQQDDGVNSSNLGNARERIEDEISTLSKVVGPEVGPTDNMHLFMERQESIEEEGKDQKQEE